MHQSDRAAAARADEAGRVVSELSTPIDSYSRGRARAFLDTMQAASVDYTAALRTVIAAQIRPGRRLNAPGVARLLAAWARVTSTALVSRDIQRSASHPARAIITETEFTTVSLKLRAHWDLREAELCACELAYRIGLGPAGDPGGNLIEMQAASGAPIFNLSMLSASLALSLHAVARRYQRGPSTTTDADVLTEIRDLACWRPTSDGLPCEPSVPIAIPIDHGEWRGHLLDGECLLIRTWVNT
jgi:hypothetical protein